jgi:hypothetical protein
MARPPRHAATAAGLCVEEAAWPQPPSRVRGLLRHLMGLEFYAPLFEPPLMVGSEDCGRCRWIAAPGTEVALPVGMSIPAGLFANIPKLIMDNLNIGFGSCSFVLFF